MNISVTILSYNSERSLQNTLESLHDFSDIVLLDSGSTDSTLSIAQRFSSVRVIQRPFVGFGPMHNIASSFAKYNWVLSLDSDEVMTDELIREIKSLSLFPDRVYSFTRKNMYRGKHIRGCGWWPDRVRRLYNRTQTSFSDALVHESIITQGMQEVDLQAGVIHTPFTEVAQFIQKIQTYSSLFADQHRHKKVSSYSPYLHAIGAFFKSYIVKRGCIDGWLGLEISVYNANCAYYKYLKLLEKN